MKPKRAEDEFPGSGWTLGFRSGLNWYKEVHGFLHQGGQKITKDSLFDLASLTKVVVTLPVCLALVHRGALDLNRPIRDYVSNAGWFQQPSLGDVEVYR